MRYDEVFVPNDQPTHTYVARQSEKQEQDLADFLRIKNFVVSISGPSKTGKTVLFRKVVDDNLVIPVSGASVQNIQDFWSVIFGWLGEPIETWETITKGSGAQVTAGGEAGISAIIAKGKASAQGSFRSDSSKATSEAIPFNPFTKLVEEIGGSDFILFIDNFHYIRKEIQPEIARIIKALAEKGVKVVTASVPHRSDDVVRANPELRGRLASIDVESWSIDELRLIATKGFPILNVDLAPSVVSRLATEAFGSPQLMQALCLNLCRNIGARDKLSSYERKEVNDNVLDQTKEDTSNFANFGSLLTALHTGPKKHGRDRRIFELFDGSRGDVYRATLLAIATGEPKRDFTYDEIMKRVKSVCVEDSPVGSSVQGALSHMHTISNQITEAPVLEWDEDNLTIIDPYFAFYIRGSRKIAKLERRDQ